MELLPENSRDFRTNAYWDRFFKTRGFSPFEWYGEFPELCSVIRKYVKCTDKVLMVGCGNSQLSADMYDVGYKNITNIDISNVAIRQMVSKNKVDRPDMKFLKMNVMEMEFSDGEFSAILDKGTLDALMVNEESDQVICDINKMFSEISRSMRLGARYIIISLLQKHILVKLLEYCSEMGYPIRFHRIEILDRPEHKKEFCMPVFAVVITKFKKIPDMKQIFEIVRQDDNVQRLDTAKQVTSIINEMQKFAMMKQHLNKNTVPGEQITLELCSGHLTIPRYILHVVDSPTLRPNKYAIFIVPLRRETEWMFAMEAGRQHLRQKADVQRLIIVILQRGHQYGDMESIQVELNAHMLELTPPLYKPGTKIPYMSLDENVTKVEVMEEGSDEFTGGYVIEDVLGDDGSYYRRLIFLNKQSLIQSESRLIEPDTKKKKGKKGKTKFVVDKSHLTCKHHLSTVAGLVLLQDCCDLLISGFRVLLIGLGGGSLATFIHKHFQKAFLDVVDIDLNMIKVAKKWFGFQEDHRMKAHVADGLEFIKQQAQNAEINPYDMIILDVDANDTTIGQHCPPKPFIELDNLENMKRILSPKGVLVVNSLFCNEDVYTKFLNTTRTVFKSIYQASVEAEVNILLYIFPVEREIQTWKSNKIPVEISDRLKVVNQSIEDNGKVNDVDLTESLRKLKLS